MVKLKLIYIALIILVSRQGKIYSLITVTFTCMFCLKHHVHIINFQGPEAKAQNIKPTLFYTVFTFFK